MKSVFLIHALILGVFLMSSAQAVSPPDAILTSDNYADEAVSKLLSNKLNVPMVTTPWGRIENTSLKEIMDLNASQIYVVGGETSVPLADQNLSEWGISVVKLFNGSNRYETAAFVAKEWVNSSSIVVASGHDREGIENAVSRAELEGGPLLVVPKDHLMDAVTDSIKFLSPQKAVIYPSPDMIQNFIKSDLSDLGLEVENVLADHKTKTLSLIQETNNAFLQSQGTNFSTESNEKASELFKKLSKESKENLNAAQTKYQEGMYNLAFTQAVLARYLAQSGIWIKQGILKTSIEKPDGKSGPEQVERDRTVKISEILLNPLQYSDDSVLIEAEVEEAVQISGKAFIKLFDGTGRIIASFPADREYMLAKGLFFMTDPQIIGKTVMVNGTVRLNVPLGGGEEDHGSFAYLIEADTITPRKE